MRGPIATPASVREAGAGTVLLKFARIQITRPEIRVKRSRSAVRARILFTVCAKLSLR